MLFRTFSADFRQDLSYLRTSGKFHSRLCFAALAGNQQFPEPSDATARMSCRTPEERKHNKDNVNKQASRIVAFIAFVLYDFDSGSEKNYSLKAEQKQFLLKNSLGTRAWVVSQKIYCLAFLRTFHFYFQTQSRLSQKSVD